MKNKLTAWFALARLPFTSVGALPFILGTVLAWNISGALRWDVLIWGILGAILIIISTNLAGEYWDFAGDTLSGKLGHNKFSGGSQVLQAGLLPKNAALFGSIICLLLAAAIGIYLQFGLMTGPWTIPLGVIGMLGGFFYSTRPVRWVSRGMGELWIAFCFGWLPVAASFYIQTQSIVPQVHWFSLPIALTIFNVILLNEFPDYEADRQTHKNNLVVRLGREASVYLYVLAAAASWIAFWLAGWLYLPVFILSLALAAAMLRGSWKKSADLEKLCGMNLLLDLGTSAVLILALII
jgi:1,4-dihydroxy-2-naphthoate octaprenyltransferase